MQQWATISSIARTGKTPSHRYISSSVPMARFKPFAIYAKAMARDQVIAGRGPRRYTRARTMLLARSVLEQVLRADRDAQGRQALAKYVLTRAGGAKNAPNITNHPLSPHLSPLISATSSILPFPSSSQKNILPELVENKHA